MVYVLEFSGTLGTHRHAARFYLGYCDDSRLDERLAEHRAGVGAAITRAAIERGYTLNVVLVIPNATRADERRLKGWKSHKRVIERYGQKVN